MRAFLDPYWRWAELTGYRYLLHDASGRIRLMLAPRRGHDIEEVMRLPGVTLVPTHAPQPKNYVSAWIEKPSAEALRHLLECADFVLAEPGMRPVGAMRDEGIEPQSLDGKVGLDGDAVVIGVVDGRCGFANEKFCLPESTPASRIDYFWDQANQPAGRWKRPHGFAYGRELDRKTLNDVLGQCVSADDIRRHGTRAEAEKALYRLLEHDLPKDADWSHGTHVLDTVLTESLASDVTDTSSKVSRQQPNVIYVQLPDDALRDTSGRWAASYVLDALHYILARAGDHARVIVNLSLGSFAGPHDGSSLLERAIDDLIATHSDRLTVVAAAGNAGRVTDDGTGQLKPCHARVTLDSAGGPLCDESRRGVALEWAVDVADTTESFMEIWIPKLGPDGQHASVTVSLQAVNSSTAEAIGDAVTAQPGESCPWLSEGKAVAALINATGPVDVPNGSGGMVLVALAHTRGSSGPCAPTGTWIVKVTNASPFPITMDAWIERRDIPGELTGFRPQYGFESAGGGLTSEGSLGTLANGKYTIVVGAAERDKSSGAYEPSDYSSSGMAASVGGCNARPVARSGPDVYCIGKRTATGFLTGSSKDLAGTSMAAAQVSGALASALMTSAKAASRAGRRGMLELLSQQAAQRQGPKASQAPSMNASDVPRLAIIEGRRAPELVLPPLPPS